MARIVEASTPAEIEAVRTLFAEYADSLGIDLSFQASPRSLRACRGSTRPREVPCCSRSTSTGTGWAVWRSDRSSGRTWPNSSACMWRAAGRGHELGSELTDAALQAAAAKGYELVRLDTLADMVSAQRLYERSGFHDTAAYRYNPIEGARFMELDLGEWRGGAQADRAERQNVESV